ncbi:hypothetical protein [Neobacillus cucumis]|uniref:hypothetical protein n=1 Tax=Neobacillus cucumis TaxID=1740721 RepID=UPI002852F783|nr:hypothetical protein [Neobacillus cucumis]MDR4948124.1 hypothetical protein [Neobacillus cucumis]
MKVGEKKTFVYIPWLDKFIEAADTMEETVRRINGEEAKREFEDKKMLRQLKKENPGKNIKKIGDSWLISEAPLD